MHRYGRHGSGAWLRQYWKRRQKRVLVPAVVEKPAVPVVVIYVPFPVEVERIVVIVAEDNNNFLGVSPTSLQNIVHPSQLAPQDTDEHPSLLKEKMAVINLAQNNADRCVDAIRMRGLSGDSILVNRDKLTLFARGEGRDIAKGESKSRSYENLNQLLEVYVQHFLSQFDQSMSDADKPGAVLSAQNWDINNIAIKDKENAPPRSQRPYHQRDLGFIRAMKYLNISLDEAPDHLEELHDWANEYDKAYSNPRKGVEWPQSLQEFQGK